MLPLFRRSILKRFVIVLCCMLPVCVPATLAWAQYPGSRAGAGGGVHVSPPPIIHAPISSAPMIHAPILYAPTTHAPISTPRMLGPAAGAFGTADLFPRRPIRTFPPVLIVYQSPFLFGQPFWGWNSCWWATCDFFWPWTFGFTSVSSPGPISYVPQVYETPVYVYGEERPDLPQLFLKDGTTLNVTDYWLVDEQLHFTLIEGDSTKPAEHVIPFDALDLQTTVDENTRRGFRFLLRNEPFEQYVRDHPEGAPPVVRPPRE